MLLAPDAPAAGAGLRSCFVEGAGCSLRIFFSSAASFFGGPAAFAGSAFCFGLEPLHRNDIDVCGLLIVW